MLKRRSFVFVMVAMLIVGLVLPAYADQAAKPMTSDSAGGLITGEPLPTPKISKEKALETAKAALKEHFGMSVEDKKYIFNMENRKDWSDPEKVVWGMNWNYNDAAEYAYANVVVDAMTGKILEISKDNGKYGEEQAKVTTITKEEAKAKAEKFIAKMVPGLLEQTVATDNHEDYYRIMYGGAQPVYYYFNYIRLVEGIKYDSNYINVGIDGATGELRNFNYRWDELKNLPSKEGIKTPEEAGKTLKNMINMELIYLPIRDPYKYEPIVKNMKLAYRGANNYSNIVDAKTGKIIDWNGKEQESNMKLKNLTDKQIQDILSKAKPITKQSKEITKERAQQVAEMLLKEHVEGSTKINAVNYLEGDGNWEAAGRKAWSIEFTVQKKDEKAGEGKSSADILPVMNGRIMIDALTEEVLSFNNWDYYGGPYDQEFKPAMTWEEAYMKAIDLIAKYHPDKINQIKTEQLYINYPNYVEGKEIPPMEYYFNFARKVNGVLYEENSINIGFNNRTGKLQNFTCRWQEDVKFPSVPKTMTAEQAKEKLLKYHQVELAYVRFNTNNDYQNPKYENRLIYRMHISKPVYQSNLVDVVTGNPLDYNGKEIIIDEDNNFEKLVAGHWIEKNAKLLVNQGIIEKATFKPDENITKMEAVKMLVRARGMDYYYPMERAADKAKFSDVSEESDDYRFLQNAIRYGIVENNGGAFNGSAQITREELAVMTVKMLKYNELAKATQIFKSSFKDQDQVDAKLLGYVAIAEGLKLVRDENNHFRPKDQATMAEAADMIYRALAYTTR